MNSLENKKLEQFLPIIVYWALALFYATASLPGLINLEILGFHIRGSHWLYIPLVAFFLFKFEKANLFKNKVLLVYLFINVIFLALNFTLRSAGFLVWLICNLIFLILSKEYNQKKLMNFFVFGLFVNSLIVIYQHISAKIAFPNIVPPHISLYDVGNGHMIFRGFGLFQEPSYLSVAYGGALIFVFHYWKKSYLKSLVFFMMMLSLSLTYSRINILVVLLLSFYFLIYYFYQYKKIAKYFFIGLFSVILAFISEPEFFGFKKDSSIQSNIEMEKSDPTPMPLAQGSIGDRTTSIKRTFTLIGEKKLMGVGIGNSKKSLVDRFQKFFPRHIVEGVHNLYLEIILEQGVFSLLLIIFMLISLQLKLKKTIDAVPLLFTLLIPMMLCQNINTPPIWFALAFWMWNKEEVSAEGI